MTDLRFAFRQLLKNPGFTAVAVLTLALGIGATAAVCSLIQGVLLTPPLYRKPEQLILITPESLDRRHPGRGLHGKQWLEWQKEAKSFEAVAGYAWGFCFLLLPGGSESLQGLAVTSDYFRVLGIPPALGRTFVDADGDPFADESSPGVIILGHTLWQRIFNGDPSITKHLVVRTVSDARPLIGAVQRELRAVDPTVAIEQVKTLEQIRSDSVAPQTFAMRLLVGFSLVASALALVGIYGVLSLSVGSRTRELAIRTAVGAQQRDILSLILREGLRLIAIGLTLGLVAALALGRVLRTFLFGVEPTDPGTLLGVAVLFAGVTLLACWVPARRATQVDPMEALRCE